MADKKIYNRSGEQLANDLTAIETRLDAVEQAVADLAQNGGNDPDGIDAETVRELINAELSGIDAELDELTVDVGSIQARVTELENEFTSFLNGYGYDYGDDYGAGGDDDPGDGFGEGGFGEGGFGGGTEDPVLDTGTQAAIDRELKNLRLIGSPTYRSVIETETPNGDYHPHGDWGMVVTVHNDVQWRSALIDAESAGTTRHVIYNMEYTEGETYNRGPIHAAVEITHGAGQQEIYPEIILPEGQYFISRDTEKSVPMKRVRTDTDWDTLNQSHEIPVTLECSWRANAGYEPGNDVFDDKYIGNGWDDTLYYWANMEFGYMTAQDPTTENQA